MSRKRAGTLLEGDVDVFGAAEPPAKRRKTKKRDPTPLQRFRAQTVARRNALRSIIRKNNRELKAILRDLGKLRRK